MILRIYIFIGLIISNVFLVVFMEGLLGGKHIDFGIKELYFVLLCAWFYIISLLLFLCKFLDKNS